MKVNNNERRPFGSSDLNIGQRHYPVVLSVAGSDSSGGAGIQADLKTFSALGVYGATAITAITAQNTQGVHAQFAVSQQMVHDQIVTVVEDISPSAVKIGMLSNVEIANVVSDVLIGDDFIIGGTVNSFDDVLYHLKGATPDYFGCGPFRFTTTKERLAPTLGIEGYKKIISQMRVRGISIPIVAIGGIRTEDISEILACVVDGIALSGSIINADNPVEKMRHIADIFQR